MAEVSIDTEAGVEIDPVTRSQPARERSEDEPFRIAVIGDFSGRAGREADARGPVKAIEIDPENFEAVMQRMNVRAAVTAGGVNLELTFRELDDFHPDAIYRGQALFRVLEEAKKELGKNPKKPLSDVRGSGEVAPPALPPSKGSASLLDMIAEQQTPAAPAAAPRRSASDPAAWDEAIRGIAAKHSLPKADPQQEQAAAQLESTAAAAMRAILGDPKFQALEAAWRSIFFLFQH
ncbi:MAG TPA: type VI secretion system contractile sheath small subunit, partial [Bryobacteraceae bacterium]|nr:type VI secretion system contractile sheath small subunit [Bryobacteraceae bacterium]